MRDHRVSFLAVSCLEVPLLHEEDDITAGIALLLLCSRALFLQDALYSPLRFRVEFACVLLDAIFLMDDKDKGQTQNSSQNSLPLKDSGVRPLWKQLSAY